MQFFIRKDEPSASPWSGFTGESDAPESPPQPARRDIRSRLRRLGATIGGTLRGVPRVLALVWQASPRLTLGLAAGTVVAGLVPAAAAYLVRMLVDTVVRTLQARADQLPDLQVLSVSLPGLTLRSPELTGTEAIVVLTLAQFLVFGTSSLATAVNAMTRQLLQERMTLSIRLKVMTHASKLDLAFFEGSKSYDLLRQAQQEATTRPVAMVGSVFGLCQAALTFASMVALLVGLSPWLALVALLAPVPAFISDARYGQRGFLVTLWASPIRRRMEYLSSLVTTDRYAKETQLFGLGGYLVDRFRLLGGIFYARQRRLVTARYLIGCAWSMVAVLAGSLTFLYVALGAVSGRLTLGDLILYTAAATALQTAVQSLFGGLTSVYENNLYLDTLYHLLATPVATRPAHPRPLPSPLRGHVVFENVSFSYPGSDHPALTDLSFEIRSGQTVALVGRNGAGKSTVVKLVARLYDPSAGRITIDGVDLRELDPDELRGSIGVMLQDFVAYQATAAENIGLGDVRHLDDRARIEASAGKAGALDLLADLPDGFDTPLGKWFARGVELSGGEWQKVALSRAFMRDTPVLLLDEPTSALDARAEHELFDRLGQLAEGRTTVYVSHRFSTVRRADRILMLDGGQLVEEGTHEELMRHDGEYAELFTMQAAAYAQAPAGQR
ncbi:ABC transporter ATP-binding protein [Plantactinospora soyae]|uniref:ATP-binding cassette subfamily B protein n=1 Tax=Plantactinospora soyae TaxID=1544732 RepID=A0A927MH57_9ACTN|nr:ABC transporter ATP-binding protein [Plantactinospora soyae]MBE1491065.1 ATP-binding cassette subfamily B protein [Plantactinospora soyae]